MDVWYVTQKGELANLRTAVSISALGTKVFMRAVSGPPIELCEKPSSTDAQTEVIRITTTIARSPDFPVVITGAADDGNLEQARAEHAAGLRATAAPGERPRAAGPLRDGQEAPEPGRVFRRSKGRPDAP